ncbi:hypothetical protein, partial [Bacillus sp. 7884-1]|uniref:hypothetical protein n=1 Tax=Bacillus sp. 7884-1 TaxID=2021693 RepID=UPI000BCD212D
CDSGRRGLLRRSFFVLKLISRIPGEGKILINVELVMYIEIQSAAKRRFLFERQVFEEELG